MIPLIEKINIFYFYLSLQVSRFIKIQLFMCIPIGIFLEYQEDPSELVLQFAKRACEPS